MKKIIDYNNRQVNDLYCTNPVAVELLLEREKFSTNVWECCNGLGHISSTLEQHGYNVRKSDIINYKGDAEIIDILTYDKPFEGSIITNPPYKYATEIAKKCIELASDKVALYNSISFLASQKRKPLFEQYPPKTVYVMSKRISCAKNGDFEHNVNGTVDYCWIVWEKGFKGNTTLKWI